MLSKEKCEKALENLRILERKDNFKKRGGQVAPQINCDVVERLIKEHFELVEKIKTGELSDGYHTFNELYYHRAVLFSVICNSHKDIAWKSKKHHDGTMYNGMFIVGIDTPQGQYSYHYDMNIWSMFDVKELEYAPKWDGHKPSDIDRLLSLNYAKAIQPYTFEDLKPNMWLWDEKENKCNKIIEIEGKNIDFYYITESIDRFIVEFEEGRFYPITKALYERLKGSER